ncbi:hypothetical protein Hypma_000235 [Hypsizygus marmoreus]|uniref:Uncharacterized protein n=1 Tax=Hypsizygus marmoreus TaxID=39966 RepID=A0A369J9H8_HYPMA|nr:hypothetical protein Hypma_000235 [Hypsizygus marmoreus]
MFHAGSYRSLTVHCHICIWAQWFPLLLILSIAHGSQAQSINTHSNKRNITIPSTSAQIVYTPFVCNASTALTNPRCDGAWQIIDLHKQTFVSTNGPAPASANIIPQMFLRFRASALYLSTSALSNSTTNITVSNNGTSTAAVFNSSVGVIAVINLPEAETTTVAITYIPDADAPFPSRLDIGSLMLTVSDNPATSVFLPSMTLPPSSAPPTFTPHPTSTNTPSQSAEPQPQSASNRTKIAEAVGITIGLGLGLTAFSVLGYVCWRRRRRRRPPGEGDSESSGTSGVPPPSRRNGNGNGTGNERTRRARKLWT